MGRRLGVGLLGLMAGLAPACLDGEADDDLPLGGAANDGSGGGDNDSAAGGASGGAKASGGAAPSGGVAAGGEATQGGAAGAVGAAGAPGCEADDWEVPASERFVARWEVADTLTLPVEGDVDFVVDWGDCTREHVTSTSEAVTHEYEEPGVYQVEVGGSLGIWTFSTLECLWIDYDGACMEAWHEGHSLSELREILHWGLFPPIGRYTFHAEYDACNITISADDAPVVEENAHGMFWGCAVAGDLSHWDMSAVRDLSSMFYDGSGLDLTLSGWDTSQVEDTREMFAYSDFDGDLSSWDVSSLEDADDMFSPGGLSLENYDALLLSWSAQTVLPAVPFGAGETQYSAAAVDARALLAASWTIQDGGLAP